MFPLGESRHPCREAFSEGMISYESGLHFTPIIERITFRPSSKCNPALTPAVQWKAHHKCVLSWSSANEIDVLSILNKFYFISSFVKAQG